MAAVNAPGGYYENESLLAARLKAALALMAMLSTFQPQPASRAPVVFSTLQINNSQTLDIHHYMVLSSSYGHAAEMTGDFVPVNLARPEMLELSDLRVDLHPDYWRARRPRGDRLAAAVSVVYRGYLAHSLSGTDTGRARAPGKATLVQAVTDLYTARSKVVHGDVTAAPVDLRAAREAYARCFSRAAERMPRLRTNPSDPMGDLTNDS